MISLTGDGKAVVREFADAPQLEVAQAKEWLDTVDEAFLFFAGADGRGQVLYRRADGDYGLLTT